MGNEQSHRHRHHHDKEEKGNEADQPVKSARKVESAPVPTPTEQCDVVISSSSNDSDVNLASIIKTGLEGASIPVYASSTESSEASKVVGKVLVDAKLLVFIVSEEAAKNSVCQDQLSLAYISNKPIVVAAKKAKKEVIKVFGVGMRLTLESLHWVVFDKEEENETVCRQFVQLVQEELSPKPAEIGTASPTESVPVTTTIAHKGRLNTKLRAQSTLKDLGGEEPQINTFWDRNFSMEDDVAWYKFQQAFLSDYESQLSGLLNDDNIPWLLDMLKNDIFKGKDKITKGEFMEIRGDSPDKNAFWRVISRVAIEKFNMREVFNMNSTVRLTAIEKLAAFQNPAVIEALIRLLSDPDPNVRAVAAISLGRTGKSTDKVIDELIALLKDGDRIVRQSACLSLGSMKAVKAIPHIGNIWRNDFISVVRNAARTALENMNIPEAKEVLQVTKILEEEIEALAGNQAAV